MRIVDPLTPQLRAIDSINPQDGAFPNALRGGVTTACTGPGSANVVGGTFTVLKLAGKPGRQYAAERSPPPWNTPTAPSAP